MYNSIVIHYDEIGLKGKNRQYFEKALVGNMAAALGDDVSAIKRIYGRIIYEISEKADRERIKSILQKIPGIAYFSFAAKSGLDKEEIKKISLNMLKNESFKTFRVTARRSNKSFRESSQKINEIIGEAISKKLGKKVSLKNNDLNLHIEICEKNAFIYHKKYSGIGGLPTGTSGKVISSLSGGLDSPVAAYLLMKRGCKVIFVHIYNKTQQNLGIMDKIKGIVSVLTKFQSSSKLYIIPFEKIQKEIIVNVPAKYRMIIYRRFMMRICNLIAGFEKAKGIVTGDSIGQVASQTLENLNCIYDASILPVFAPLAGSNKQEIMDIARNIGTYEKSIIDCSDCCSFNIAEHPETKAKLEDIKKIESRIPDQEKLVEDAIKEKNVVIIKS